ncbi:MAG: fibronectin type III domain-containing protein [Nitrospinae bacterium]|nr:fibronectin type III domain-containing protein [Nitrospinota bacterium]
MEQRSPTRPSFGEKEKKLRLMRKSLLAALLALGAFACGNTTQNTFPTGVTAQAGAGEIALTWLPVGGASSYNVYYNTVANFGTASTGTQSMRGLLTTSTTVPNLTNGVTYYFVVTAVSSTGESVFSTEVSAIPSPVPTNVTVTSAGTGQATVSWTMVSGATYYSIYYSTTTPVNLSTAQNVQGITASPYTVTGLASGVTYYFVVAATSPPSSQAVFTPQ